MIIDAPSLDALLTGALGGTGVMVGSALAIGIRHGIDWDHIAAITDITSTTSGGVARRGSQHTSDQHSTAQVDRDAAGGPVRRYFDEQRQPFLLGSLYALGHAAVVTVLGLLAILASEFLPDWIDPVMSRVVGVTLIALAIYLFFSLYQYARGGELHLRSRWMLVFAVVRRGYRLLMARVFKRLHHNHPHEGQYGARTAFGVGLIHGVGAETGTQALVIASVVGATNRASAIVVLIAFVVGLLISNSIVTVATTTGFISSQRRQWLYAAAGLVAAVFSLVLGVKFLFGADASLPDLG
ncbi:MAG: hypothetical protein DWI58_13480 [Chloroflexi bacterium]|nr:MAG: hypothetical protein DWI58_13480 [Chloroflexota bacterium]